MAKLPPKARSKRPRGQAAIDNEKFERTGIHFRVADEVWYAMYLLAEKRSTPEKPVTFKAIHDAAVLWLLDHEAKETFRGYVVAQKKPVQDQPFWLDSKLEERAVAVGLRDGVARNRVIDTAFQRYVAEFGERASKADIARLKALEAKNPGRAWRIAHKAGSRYRSRVPRPAAKRRRRAKK